LTVHGFPGYPAGQALPTLKQVLDGEKPANTDPIRVDMLPGFRWRYSGGGYTVLQQLLIDALNRPFPELLKETVLDPAGMTESVFSQPS
jgi:CubicO group peptidase (beta-lactamase class C family)